jgi:dTDP-4-dehydrorhamnose reductase
MLGSYLMEHGGDAEYELIPADRTQFDLNQPDQAYRYVRGVAPAVVVHLAAETNVDLCEKEPGLAGLRNQLSTKAIARACADLGARILYVSTSNVFGADGNLVYNELDLPRPVNYYGRSKLFGETEIRAECSHDHLIVRAGWMVGGGERDHKFVGKIVEQIRGNAQVLKAVGDKYGTITRAHGLADFLWWACRTDTSGTYHFSSRGLVTRYELARRIAHRLSFPGEVFAVASSQFPLPAPRPVSEGIESIYLAGLSGAPQTRGWAEDLDAYLVEFGL